MAYRVSQSQADLASAYASELDTAILNRPILSEFASPSSTIPQFAFSSSAQRQYSGNNQLPSLPALFSVPPFDFEQFSLSPVNNFSPQYQRHVPSPPTFSYDQNQERSSWVPSRPEPAFPQLDTAPSVQEPHPSAAPPQTQQLSRLSSLTTHTQLPQPNRSAPDTPSDDYYLAALVDNNFSSPSLPPINSSPLPPSRPHSSNVPKPLEVGERISMHRPVRRRASKAGLVDLTKEEPDQDSAFGVDPRAPTMPRKRTAAAANGNPASKRRRTSQSSPSSSNKANKSRRIGSPTAASPYADDGLAGDATNQDGHETIDLSNASEVPQELMAPKVDKRIKLGTFQCVICMDNCASLTVTHCGHLFCSECLHSALHIDNMKKTCPVCRTKVDLKDKKGKNAKSFYHLELKIMTANKKGKQPASSS
ncbi:multidrug-resistance type transporter aminotriazole resistance [Hypoxylon texense]